jgi:hypothetical protein
MSDLNRREAMKRATAVGVAASATTLLAATVRAEGDLESAQEGQPSPTAPGKQQPVAGTSNHVPISIFIRGRQQIQLTGRRPVPGGPTWSATAADPSVVHVTVQPVEIGPFPVEYWELTIIGLKIGQTQVHVQERQATHPIIVRYDFVLDVTVLGLQQ